MGTGKKGFKRQGKDWTATELFGDAGGSEARQIGRRLTLRFLGKSKPELDRAEFHAQASKAAYIQQRDPEHSFTWTRVLQALSLLFLEYLCAALEGREADFCFRGARTASLAASLGDAMGKNTGILYDLFKEAVGSTEATRLKWVLDGHNLHGKEDNERRIIVRSEYLPADCVEVFWEGKPLVTPEALRAFGNLIRKAWELEPSQQPDPPSKEEPKQAAPTEDKPPVKPRSAPATSEPASSPKPEPEPSPKQSDASPKPSESTPATEPKTPSPSEPAEQPSAAQSPKPSAPLFIPIDPALFTVPESSGYWPDDAPLISFAANCPDWTLGNAFEGAIIFGATGSGKTSGSGAAIAETFLRAGFGGLVLTVKQKEADHWRRLCARCGREKDLVVVQRGGDWRLNLLAYEAQRPGRGAGLCDNLVDFCQNLLDISSRNHAQSNSDPLWPRAARQLLNATFDLFLLAGGGITFDRLADFVGAAPTEAIPATEKAWQQIPVFGEILLAATKASTSEEDQRLLGRALNYWFKIYPGLAPKTRTSISLGVFVMLDAFRGRDVPALISSETNITPESILSGKIVVLDLPIKVFKHTGLLVQSAWKYLFQTTVEREDHAGDPHRRPAFLWEDEGQHFFSSHDNHFQATARSSRVSRVILTQNLHGFSQELGRDGYAAAKSIFANLNTKIFHANSDPDTNAWAAKMFGTEIQNLMGISHGAMPQPKDAFDYVRQQFDPTDRTSVSFSEHRDFAVQPEAFHHLRMGGTKNDFRVDAFVTWLGLGDEHQPHFTLTTFQQHQHPS
jgi:hypothetical protein